MPASPAVRVVVVTWNGAHLLEPCLSSLLAQRLREPMEVVLVDNASTDGTVDLVGRLFPAVRVVQADRNLGFAGGAALGARGFAGDFIVLLNNDATFAPDAVQALVDCAQAPGNERVGAVTAKVLLDPGTAGPVLVNSTGGLVTTSGTGADRDWLVPDGDESTEPDVFGFCGAAALLRRATLDDVGSFDPELFLYYEDTDLSWRLRSGGWVVRYEPRAVAHHRHASSSDAESPLFRYQNTRNSLTVFARHAPLRVVLLSFIRQTAGWLRSCLVRGPADPLSRARARGLWHAVRRARRTLRERRVIWRGAVTPRRDVARYLTSQRGAR